MPRPQRGPHRPGVRRRRGPAPAGQLRRGLKGLGKEGFRRVHVLHGEDEVAAATIVREPLLNDRTDEHGPFDVIGDVHGCRSEPRVTARTTRLDAPP